LLLAIGVARASGWLAVTTTGIGAVLGACAAVLAGGSLYHLYRVRRAARELPPPGRMIDVGGFRMHILAEGSSNGKVPVIWVTGGHGQGLLMHHLHRHIAQETRSILFDRAGSGWSEAGPFPRTIGREVDELARLLDGAGEKGPFLLVGHSFGGMFCANFAQRHRDRVAGLILLDATPPWNVAFARDVTFTPLRAAARKGGLAALFGLGWRRRAMDEEAMELGITKEFEGLEDQIRLEHALPRTWWSSGSALWTPCLTPFDMAIGAGALGDLPLLSIHAPSDPEGLRKELQDAFDLTEFQIENLLGGLNDAMLQFPRLSSRGELIHAPEGTGHMFPYETPDFVLEKTREMIDAIGRGGAPA
jgi:pimeloyl-ACP methyl ester carboxylesterase